ncbi:MAG: glycine/sarcosine/betaine reductase selenoprotein B family protein [Pseudomonadota bacterium]|nr:glycine/sarcosine/betaine reductase selenoprotein B family protein [Pseudomonadota bacterium]
MSFKNNDGELVMTDTLIKTGASQVDCPQFEDPAFVTPKPLSEAKIAIVTSASLHHEDDDDFAPSDTGFRQLHRARRDIVVGHWSPNFDASGVAQDLNVVFPIDRLEELAAKGEIGSVSDVHLAVAGNQFDLAGIKMDGGPAGAALLNKHEVDVVLLTPV